MVLTITELIAIFGETRRVWMCGDANFAEGDSNLNFIRQAVIDGKIPNDFEVSAHYRGFIHVQNGGASFGSIYDNDPADNYAYDGPADWRDAEMKRLGLSEAELLAKIALDTIPDVPTTPPGYQWVMGDEIEF